MSRKIKKGKAFNAAEIRKIFELLVQKVPIRNVAR